VLDFIERERSAVEAKPALEAAPLKRIALSDVRQIIAERMATSWRSSPMVTLNVDVDCSSLKKLREDLKSSFKEKWLNLSYNYILMKVCAVALKEFPSFNSYLEGNEIVMYDQINIGLAVATEEALLVPVVKNVSGKNLYEIASDGDALIEKARKGELTIDDVTGGTFTITNLGMFGIRDFTPIINPPQCAILGVGEMKDKPCVCDGQILVKPIMALSLTFDHRIVDGAQGAIFISRVRELLENPLLLISALK